MHDRRELHTGTAIRVLLRSTPTGVESQESARRIIGLPLIVVEQVDGVDEMLSLECCRSPFIADDFSTHLNPSSSQPNLLGCVPNPTQTWENKYKCKINLTSLLL